MCSLLRAIGGIRHETVQQHATLVLMKFYFTGLPKDRQVQTRDVQPLTPNLTVPGLNAQRGPCGPCTGLSHDTSAVTRNIWPVAGSAAIVRAPGAVLTSPNAVSAPQKVPEPLLVAFDFGRNTFS